MTSPDPYPEDELDYLLRRAVKARLGGQEPPDRVWKQVKSELRTDQTPPPRASRVTWSSLGIQVALSLLLVVLGGIGLRTLLTPVDFHGLSRETSPSETAVYLEEHSTSSREVIISDDQDVHLLRTLSRTRSLLLWQDVPGQQTPLVVPPDAPPHPSSAEGRLLAAALSPPDYPVVAKSRPVFGGPYQK